MKKTPLIISLLFFAFSAYSQTQWYTTSVPHLRHINSVAILAPDRIISAGGNEFNDSLQSIFFSGDQGLNWEINPLDDISAWIKSVDFADQLHGVGVGYSGKMVKTYDGGHIWAKAVTPVGNTRHFNKVFFLDSLTGFVAGGWPAHDSIQTILKSTDGGSTWNIAYDQPGFWLRSVFFINALNGFAVGDSGVILKTINGGTAWSPVSSPVVRNFNSLAFINDTIGYIVGGDATDSIRTILQTTNGGASWTVVKDEPGGVLSDVYFMDLSNGYIVGAFATFYKTINGGQAWTPAIVNGALSSEYFTSVRFHSQNFGLIGARGGKVHVYTTSQLPDVTTFGSTVRDSATVTFSGLLNTHGYPGSYSFVFAQDSAFSQTFATYWIPKQSSAPVLVQYTQGSLVPHSTYYFAARGTTLAGTAYGDTLSFFTETPSYLFETMPPESITTTSATLKGYVNKLPSATNLYFEYDTSAAFSNVIAATPATVNDTAQHLLTAQVTSLTPYTIYYYRLKGIAGGSNYYGNIFSFFSGSVYTELLTLPATNITDSTATLNASINKFRMPATLSFEYTTNPTTFGNSIPATPGSVNDTLQHTLIAQLTNLQPLSVYYFRIKAHTSFGDYFGPTMSFTNGEIFSDFQTLPATGVVGSSAVLNGTLDGFQFHAALSFEYGTTPSLSNSVTAIPANVTDTLQHHISAMIDSLLPYTMYYFRLKAQTSAGDFYGLSLPFFTGSPFTAFQTTSATNVTVNSAQLNGVVDGARDSMTLGFDYGATTAFGSYVSGTPSSVSDTFQHAISADISGLNTDALYYFRLHGTTAAGDHYYGDTVQVFIGYSEILNWDFQYWNIDTVSQPVEWNLILDKFERVSGVTGSALKIYGGNVAILGIIGEGIFGGQAFNFRPDSVSCYLNYNIESGDTGLCGVFLYKGTTMISENFYDITSSSGGQFTKLTFPLSYSSSLTPDSLAIAYSTTNIKHDIIPGDHPGSFMIIDDIHFTPSSAPAVANGGFERWYEHPIQQPLDWYFPAFIYTDSADFSKPYMARVMFEAPGDYAVELSNVEYQGRIIVPELANFRQILWDGKLGTPVKARHNTLNGFYRYFPENGDTMEIYVMMHYQGGTIAYGNFRQFDTVPDFAPFEIPLNYMNSVQVPDSITIRIAPSLRDVKGLSRVALDKLSFDGFVNGEAPIVPVQQPEDGINIFPNPASATITIQLEKGTGGTLQIFSLAGKLVYTSEFQGSKADVITTDFSKGLYLVRILQKGRRMSDKFMVIH